MKVIHNRNFNSSYLDEYVDRQYFRILHDLKEIKQFNSINEAYYLKTVEISTEKTLVVETINACYETISIDEEKVSNWTKEETFDPNLWVWAMDKYHYPAALGIANFDSELKEGNLEWIQVIPNHRGSGIGQLIVNELLQRLRLKAVFVTVSGEIDNSSNPQQLYRRCGFYGNDIWHILTRK